MIYSQAGLKSKGRHPCFCLQEGIAFYMFANRPTRRDFSKSALLRERPRLCYFVVGYLAKVSDEMTKPGHHIRVQLLISSFFTGKTFYKVTTAFVAPTVGASVLEILVVYQYSAWRYETVTWISGQTVL